MLVLVEVWCLVNTVMLVEHVGGDWCLLKLVLVEPVGGDWRLLKLLVTEVVLRLLISALCWR